jgi:hypothetical protein
LGTRNVILADHEQEGFYGSQEFRWNAVAQLEGNLHPGEVLYFELTGYTNDGTPIMSPQNADKSASELKAVRKQFGETITYTYGQELGTCGLWVYRITRVAEDGSTVELPWNQVKARCRELAVNHVPDRITDMPLVIGDIRERERLPSLLEHYTEGASPIDDRHPTEGVVVRVERPDGGTEFLKFKGFTFGLLEGYIKSNDDYVDAEEIS